MPGPRPRPRPRSRPKPRSRGVETCVATFVAASACAAVWLFDHGMDGHAPPQPSAAAGFAATAPPATEEPRSPAPQAAAPGTAASPTRSPGSPAGSRNAKPRGTVSASDPLRVRIPSVAVQAPLTRLGLTPDGALEAPPPEDENLAGWYADGTPPGAVGTALIAGHVDNAEGPAVFYPLGAVQKGATVEVARRDGFVAVFTVDAVEVYVGDDFPDEKVYGPSRRPELRLITCGGTFDEKADEYTGNVVVFAHLTDVRRAGADDG